MQVGLWHHLGGDACDFGMHDLLLQKKEMVFIKFYKGGNVEYEKLLKLDPTNTELLVQKQNLLADSISSTSEKLDALKAAEAQVQVQFERGEIAEEQYREFQREIIKLF